MFNINQYLTEVSTNPEHMVISSFKSFILVLFVIIIANIILYVYPYDSTYLNVFYILTNAIVFLFLVYLLFFAIIYCLNTKYNWGNIRPISFITVFLLLIALTCMALFPYVMKFIVIDRYNSQGYFNDIYYNISQNNNNDTAKINAILDWENKNMHNEYHNVYIVPITGLFSNTYITSNPPYTIFMRTYNNDDPRLPLITLYGNCGESSISFMYLANAENLTVRRIELSETTDHAFDEVYINGSWMTIDPVWAVNGYDISAIYDNETWCGLYPNQTPCGYNSTWFNVHYGYNVPKYFYEDIWNMTITKVTAYYPNGTIEDLSAKNEYKLK